MNVVGSNMVKTRLEDDDGRFFFKTFPLTTSRAKKSRASDEGTGNVTADGVPSPAITRSKRWAPVSGSANVDYKYKLDTQNPVTAYQFVCLCQPPFSNGDDEDDDEDDEEEEEDEDADKENGPAEPDGDEQGEKEKRPKCDGGKTCLCDKPAELHPDHMWEMSRAGKIKFFLQRTNFALRDPDNFNMYTFNDHAGYGVLEMLQNLILDFEEATSNYKEQWAVCEALAFFLQVDVAGALIGRLCMSMLALLERDKLLAKDSEIKNLGLIMALFMTFACDGRPYGLLEESKQESLGPAKDKKWEPHAFDSNFLAYARKYGIDLAGPHDIRNTIKEAEADADLPNPASNTGSADPFSFAKELKKYKKERGGVTAFLAGSAGSRAKVPIGGDSLDITTWTSAERKKAAYDKKDPLGKKDIYTIKEGLIMDLA
ncbi:uncharacterized protein B0T15DRAFT_575016 [Chaetomium strumarium]|uniref:Uncharacterized protein n=1 Tax=Chaetomium strumarium TaxID=1170767 RepID=A0AAJ0M1P5_9PEZI|nr:hypothetical protein B0T15DRAFT_575016 [Chaetomium strumarium]